MAMRTQPVSIAARPRARPDGVRLSPSTDSSDPSRVIQMTLVDLVTGRPSPSAP